MLYLFLFLHWLAALGIVTLNLETNELSGPIDKAEWSAANLGEYG